MGGEKSMQKSSASAALGSPPHGRGKGCSAPLRCGRGRITPAWAGKSLFGASERITGQDHPRMGGEKSGLSLCEGVKRGSPPHGRGKVDTLRESKLRPRITPAWAGKSLFQHRIRQVAMDHPRMGGEKQHDKPGMSKRMGSPPHGRGKGKCGHGKEAQSRITPAWAGKRLKSNATVSTSQDHPRMGGEKQGAEQAGLVL